MDEFLGIILIEETEILLRIYKISSTKWQLLHFGRQNLLNNQTEKQASPLRIAEAVIDFLSTTHAQKVIDWRICARNVPRSSIQEVALAINLPIELLEKIREQELLCKGLCTEFW